MFRRSSLRTKLAFLGLLVACVSLLVAGRVAAQTPFPPQSLLDASTLQQAVAVLGAAQAERSSHLLIDAPDVTGPGRYSLVIRSEIPGTSILVLLKTTLASPGMSATPSRTTTMLAERLVPGARATARLELEAETSQHLSLYAFARGRWFVATREVKLGRSVRAD